MYNLYEGAEGVVFEHDIKEKGVIVPLSGAIVYIDVYIDGEKKERKTASIIDATNGIVSYTLDFEVAGLYELQGEIHFPNDSVIPTSIDKFKVKKKK